LLLFDVVSLNLKDLSERYCVTIACRESVRKWFHGFSRLLSVERRFRVLWLLMRLCFKMHGLRGYVCSAVDVDFREIMAIYASWSRNMLIAMKFTRIDLSR
jgi:hypothetical protein